MNQPNFEQMTTPELRSYVLSNRKDEAAFHALSDRIQQHGAEFSTFEELAAILERKQFTSLSQPMGEGG
jgi:hypothetical protein